MEPLRCVGAGGDRLKGFVKPPPEGAEAGAGVGSFAGVLVRCDVLVRRGVVPCVKRLDLPPPRPARGSNTSFGSFFGFVASRGGGAPVTSVLRFVAGFCG